MGDRAEDLSRQKFKKSVECLAFGHQASQQRRGLPELGVVVRVLGKALHGFGHVEQAHGVGVVHGATAPEREAVAGDVDHVDVAGLAGNALFQNVRGFVDQREHQALNDFVVRNLARGDAHVSAVLFDHLDHHGAGDRIAFAGVGKYNEFDSLRVLGVRSADLKGYQFSREDVDARSLANQYAQIIGQTFTHEVKPLEVEILVAELGVTPAGDQLFHIMYDGTVIDEKPFIVIGGDTDTIKSKVTAAFKTDMSLKESCNLARTALSSDERTLQASDLEVTLLQRNGSRRCFKRLTEDALAALLD